MRTLRRLQVAALVGLSLSVFQGQARASEFYYILIFGSQDCPKHLRYTHTWATFVKAVGEGPDASNYDLEAHTISWLPASLNVKVLSPFPETGVNYDLNQTLHFVRSQGESVTVWGPFRIDKRVYDRSLQVHGILDTGMVQYRAISTAQNLLISDCIHAVAAVDPELGRNHYPLIRIGKPASRFMARQVRTRTRYDQDTVDHSWVIPRLGLDPRTIEVISPREIRKLPFDAASLPGQPMVQRNLGQLR